jgi:biopolymer transport protein ExbB
MMSSASGPTNTPNENRLLSCRDTSPNHRFPNQTLPKRALPKRALPTPTIGISRLLVLAGLVIGTAASAMAQPWDAAASRFRSARAPQTTMVAHLAMMHQPPSQPAADNDSNTADTNDESAPAETSGPSPDDGDGDGEASDEESAGDRDAAAGGLLGSLADFFNTPPLGYMIQGGVFMWPILLMGIIGAGVIIERYRSLNMLATDSAALRQEVREMLDNDQVREAFDKCNDSQGPVPAILATGLRKYLVLQKLGYEPAKVEEQVVKSMDDYSVHIVAALERHLPILATISSAAPMLGFLGTVQGMIVAFDDIVMKMGETNIVEAAAAGIKVSLMTTCFGLIIGIPAFVAFNYFTGVINRFVLDVEESATEMIEAVTLQSAIASVELPAGGSETT